jgi:hypothetical protein
MLISIGLTATITAMLSRFLGSPSAAALIGGLTSPLLACGWGAYGLNNLEVDSAPPGMLLRGGLTIILAMRPFTLLTGFRVPRRQHLRNGS